MNQIANSWKHPKTSVAGVLIAVVTISGVLSQQGITLGQAGTGTVVALLSALASALLGLLAKDPGSSNESGSAAKLGAGMLILLLIPLPWTTGCSTRSVAQEIVNWTPALQTAVATINSTAALLDPAASVLFTAATTGFDAASNLLVAQAKAYLTTPGSTTLQALQNQIVTFEQQVNTALLSAVKITNATSQKQAVNAINAVLTIVSAILALIASISSSAAKTRMAAQATVKLSAVEPYFSRDQAAHILAAQEDLPLFAAQAQIATFSLQATHTGF